MGTYLLHHLQRGLSCTDVLNQEDPEAVIQAHLAFLDAGARTLTTNTFCCDPLSLKDTEFSIKTLSRQGALLAQKARQIWLQNAPQDTLPVEIWGSLGPGWLSPEKGEITPQALETQYARRAEGLLQGNVDGFVMETIQDLQQAEAAYRGVQRALAGQGGYSILMLVSLSGQQRGQPGAYVGQHTTTQALQRLQELSPQGLGINCGEGPLGLEKALTALNTYRGAVVLKPNAGPPGKVLSPEDFAAALQAYRQCGFSFTHWGGCCGATPAHIAALSQQGLEI